MRRRWVVSITIVTAEDEITLVTHNSEVTMLTRWSGNVDMGPADAIKLGWALVRTGIKAALT